MMTLESYGGATVLSGFLAAQIVSLPTGSNGGGFSWSYDPALGTWSRSVDSFGPQTAERSQTVGRGKLNFGFFFQRFTFDALDRHEMSVSSQGVFSGLDLQERVTLSRADVSLNTTYVNHGLTSRLDVGCSCLS